MNEELHFLRDAAVELRRLASLAPEIRDNLRQLAEDLERSVARIEDGRPGGMAS
jgi:hypothetical protein